MSESWRWFEATSRASRGDYGEYASRFRQRTEAPAMCNLLFRAVQFSSSKRGRSYSCVDGETLTSIGWLLTIFALILFGLFYPNHTCAKVISSRIFLRLYQVLGLRFAYTAILGLPCEEVEQRGQRLTYQTEAHPKYAVTNYPAIRSLHLL